MYMVQKSGTRSPTTVQIVHGKNGANSPVMVQKVHGTNDSVTLLGRGENAVLDYLQNVLG